MKLGINSKQLQDLSFTGVSFSEEYDEQSRPFPMAIPHYLSFLAMMVHLGIEFCDIGATPLT
jgi:hypothetical protein